MDMVLTFLADLLMVAAALGAAAYCLILSRRLTRLSSIDKGLGGAIAVLSAQVDDMNASLEAAKSGSASAIARLEELTRQAREIAGDLEVMIAACHDVPTSTPPVAAQPDLSPEPQETAGQTPVGEDGATPDIPVFERRRSQTQAEAGVTPPLFRHHRSTPAGASR
ncbi:hypothetical protein E2K80_17000 [Rhodophyticola sp. CCM32]|uniref:DUF6468 domain-containing protein n=1 Tax=Rhodophyticola sp. CCM32 TaxID=2916397 RepID=UPI00107FBDE9|nr:DUF6468 domain-containing protein [Rhodophyticola sp. CCM32]QBY02227.1 hypothetical protein E2K80_17000 [Rhodophyticola sp. CCM32]